MAFLKSSTVLTACALVALIVIVTDARPGGDHGHGHGHGGMLQTCMNATIVRSPQWNTANATCRTQLNLTSNAAAAEGAAKNKNWHCMKSCMMKEMGVITATDTLNSNSVNSFVDAMFPEAARASLKTEIGACSTTPADPESTDTPCGKTKSLEKCIGKAIFKVCKPGEKATPPA